MRPLSQAGMIRIPKNPKQRPFGEGGSKAKGTTLDAYNETLEDKVLHPTKGYRKVKIKRSRAEMLVAEILNGQGRPLDKQRRFLQHGY